MATTEQRKTDRSVAKQGDNARLEHTMGGVTTRDDANDLGVPMLPGRPDEPKGPEDALGEGPKRGDYRGRIGPENYLPHEVLLASPEDVLDPDKPSTRVAYQRPRADEIGDAPGKGGVTV